MKFQCRALGAALLVMVGGTVSAWAGERFDLDDPNDAIKVLQKQICSLNEGEPVLHWWQGSMMSRREGERDRKLFAVQGMNMRACKNFDDPERGHGFRSVGREVMLYLDPETNEVLKTWENPWTGEVVDVIHVANDPVNMGRPLHAIAEDGTPYSFRGTFMKGRVISGGATPLFYKNPLGGAYQDYIGGTYHAMEMGSTNMYEDELMDSSIPAAYRKTISWSRVSEWLPWMKMGDRGGVVFFATVGKRAAEIDDLPEPLRTEIRTNYTTYLTPPPLDDDRSNMTSWVSTKQAIDAARAADGNESGGE